MRAKRLWNVTLCAVGDWWNDNCMRLSASLAFYTALSLAPLVIIVVGLAGLVTERQHVVRQLESQIGQLMGQHGQQVVLAILNNTEPRGGLFATIIGLGTLIIGATAVFGELQAALNLIWEVKPKPASSMWGNVTALLKGRLLSLAIVLAMAFLLLVSLVMSALMAGAVTYLRSLEHTQLLPLNAIESIVSIVVITLLFALLFKYVPDAQIAWRDVWLGAAISAVLFTIGKKAIGYYIGQASVGSAYGAAGSLVALLVWVYYSALIVFFGAEFTHSWATHERVVEPKAYAEPGATPQTKAAAAAKAASDTPADASDT